MQHAFKAARVLTIAALPFVPMRAEAQMVERSAIDSDKHQTVTITCSPTFSIPRAEEADKNKWVFRCRAPNDQIFGKDEPAGNKQPEIVNRAFDFKITFKLDWN